MACHRIVMIYHLRLFIDLEQCEMVGVNIQRANVHLWAFEVALAIAPIADLLSPATYVAVWYRIIAGSPWPV
jgi:hypothetical protein